MPGRNVSHLILVVQNPNNVAEAKEMLAFARAYAKWTYGCTTSACVVTFTTLSSFTDALSQYDTITTLGILSHAGNNMLTFYEDDPDVTGGSIDHSYTLAAVAAAFGAPGPTVETVEFLGCRVGKDPKSVWDFAQTLNLKKAVASNAFHCFHPVSIRIDANETAASLGDELDVNRGYLLQGTDLAAAASQRNKSVQLWIEWFHAGNEKQRPGEVDAHDRRTFFTPRSDMTVLPVVSEAQATTLSNKWRGQLFLLSYDSCLIEVKGPAAP